MIVAGVCSTCVVVANASSGENSSTPAGGITRKGFEYTFEVNGSQIFPNETIKNDIVNNYKQSEYHIPSLQYELLGHRIDATGVTIGVDPSRIDDEKTRLGLNISAEQANVTGAVNKSFGKMDLKSVYGIYDEVTDKITVHVPITEALSLLR
jgi:hypothetical protein